jgi:phage shock protein C
MNSARTRFYRDKANGKWMGVCAGIADYTGVEVLWVRLAFVVTTVCGMGFMPVVYLALGFLSQNKPTSLYADAQEQKFWQGVRQSPTRTAREVRAVSRSRPAPGRSRSVLCLVQSAPFGRD